MLLYIAIFSICIFLFSITAKKIEEFPLSGPLLFVVVGVVLGPLALNVVDIEMSHESYELLAELALAIVLFVGASKADLSVLKSSAAIPFRLLLVGLPLTILFGVVFGYFVFDEFGWIELAILATVLAPTDAALGEAVVTNKAVPPKIREALNVESGLNDGISVPVFLLLLALYKATGNDSVTWEFGLGLFAKEIGLGLVIGFLIMIIGAKLLVYAHSKDWIAEEWKPIIVVALTFTTFTIAQLVGGSGFIACFTGGFIYGIINKKYGSELLKHAEGAGNSLTFIIWMIFGSFVITTYYEQFTLQIFIYAVLSLTIVRIVPVLISLIGVRGTLKEKLFIGWFGPRGLASIVFAIMLLEVKLPHLDKVIPTILCTVFLSVILHGITANPMARSFKKKSNNQLK